MKNKVFSSINIFIIRIVLLIAGILFSQSPSRAGEFPVIHVGLIANQAELTVESETNVQLVDLAAQTVIPSAEFGEKLSFTTSSGLIFINDIPCGVGPFLVIPEQNFLSWNSKLFRGQLIISLSKDQLNLVNRVQLEDYLRGVVPKEMSPLWPMAALKAQALAARTYTVASLGRHQESQFDLCATTHCQVYGGIAAEFPATDQAVLETKGMIIVYQGKHINAYYHAAAGSFTEDSANIWSNQIAYLKPVPDWDQNSPYFQWTRSFKWEEIQALAAKSYPQLGALKRVIPFSLGKDGRVYQVLLVGEEGETVISGEQFRFLIGLPSSNIQIGLIYGPRPYLNLWWLQEARFPQAMIASEDLPGLVEVINPAWDQPDPWSWLQDKDLEILVIRGQGYGHRVGMSQWGAKGMAENGYNETQIIRHYYPGTTIKLLDQSN